VPQRHHRINTRSPQCRDGTGKRRAAEQNEARKHDRGRAGGGKAKEQFGDLALGEPRRGHGKGNSNRESKGSERQRFPQNHPDNVGALGAQSDTNANFAGSIAHALRHQAIEADTCEKKGEGAEKAREHRHEPLLSD
jgi:hypothetical protein